MSRRRVSVILILWSAGVVVVAACSEPTRHEVLSFFFDGVPDPREAAVAGYVPLWPLGRVDGTEEGADRFGPPQKTYSHTPFRENACARCHDLGRGLLWRTPQQGLCASCHPDLPGEVAFVHGPVAVMDCLHCHSPHAAVHPKLLLKGIPALCHGCHERGELTVGEHHDRLDGRSCIECHDPHGGSNRFFVKRSEP